VGLIAKRKYNAPLIIDEYEDYSLKSLFEHNLPALKTQNLTPSLTLHSLATYKSIYTATIKTLRYLCFHTADKIVIDPTKRNNNHYAKNFTNTVIIPQYVKIVKIEEKKQKQHLNWQISDNTLLVGFVGRITAKNDIKGFIRACKLITLELTDVNFKLFSSEKIETAYLNECRKLINILELCRQIEIVDNGYIEKYLPALDVLISTSTRGDDSFFILKAMRYGIPLAVTEQYKDMLFGHIGEDRELGAAGLIIESKNPEHIAQKVLALLNDKELRKELAKTCKKQIKNIYSQRTCLQSYLKLYKYYLEKLI